VYSLSPSKDRAVRRTTATLSTPEDEIENHQLTGAVVNELEKEGKEEYDLLRRVETATGK